MDLFEVIITLPQEVQDVIATFEDETYDECRRLLDELEPLGYTFEYYLDAVPFNLKKL